MHDQRVGLGEAQLVVIEPEKVEVFARRGDKRAVHPLALQAQHHHDIGPGQPAGHVVIDLDAKPLDGGRQQGARRHDPHPRPHRVEQGNVRAGDTAVQDIAADRDDETAEPAFAAPDRQRVEQGLGGMLVTAVAGIDDGAVDLFGQQLNRARFGMTHDQHVGMHRIQRHRRVDQRLALAHRAHIDRHVDHIGAEPLAGQFE
jgi:hypothetical protein